MTAAPAPAGQGDEIVVPLPPAAMEHFTGEAKAYVQVELQRYVADITTRARHKTAAEVVVKDDVAAVVESLRPRASAERVKLINDWVKRGAFLVIGLAIAQGKLVSDQDPIMRASVNWLLAMVALAAALITAAVVIDIMAARSKK